MSSVKNSCRDCRYMLVFPNPDPDDWFRDEDVGVKCLLSQKTMIQRTEYLYREGLEIPSWCKLTESEKIIKKEIKEFVNSLYNNFGKNDIEVILRAIELMINLHSEQKKRPDGKPYIWHILDVSNRVLNKFKVADRDIVVAALLHDSVEDQVFKLAGKVVKDSIDIDQLTQGDLRRYAFAALENDFGKRVVNTIKGLTNPIISNKDPEEKRVLYKKHVEESVKNSDVFVVKYADFSGNALQIHNIKEGSKKRIKFEKKYGPVLNEVFIPIFKNMDNSHPLYDSKEKLLKEAKEYYNKYYI